MNENGKSTRKKLLRAVSVTAGTCVVAAGTFFLTDSVLAFINTKVENTTDHQNVTEKITDHSNAKETELLARTDDSFSIRKERKPGTPATEKSSTEGEKKNDDSSTGDSQGTNGSEATPTGTAGENGDTLSGDENGSGGGGDYGNGYVDGSNGNESGYEGGSNDGGSDSGSGENQGGNQGEDTGTIQPPPTEMPDAGLSDSYLIPDSDERYLTEEELSVFSAEDLETARNEMFARHGRIFTTEKWASYFGTKSWYVPQYTQEEFDSLDLFNDCEKANLKLILALEEQSGS